MICSKGFEGKINEHQSEINKASERGRRPRQGWHVLTDVGDVRPSGDGVVLLVIIRLKGHTN